MYKILNAEKLSANVFLMDVEAPRVAKHCLPGQFVIVKMDEVGERIPLTICDYDAEKGTVTIVFQPAGASTTRMAAAESRRLLLKILLVLWDSHLSFAMKISKKLKKRKYRVS